MAMRKAVIKYKVSDPKLRVVLEDLKNVINSIIDALEGLELEVLAVEDELAEHIEGA